MTVKTFEFMFLSIYSFSYLGLETFSDIHIQLCYSSGTYKHNYKWKIIIIMERYYLLCKRRIHLFME